MDLYRKQDKEREQTISGKCLILALVWILYLFEIDVMYGQDLSNGLGIEVVLMGPYPSVVRVIKNSPASRLGVNVGDQLLWLEREDTVVELLGLPFSKLQQLLEVPVGNSVIIGLLERLSLPSSSEATIPVGLEGTPKRKLRTIILESSKCAEQEETKVKSAVRVSLYQEYQEFFRKNAGLGIVADAPVFHVMADIFGVHWNPKVTIYGDSVGIWALSPMNEGEGKCIKFQLTKDLRTNDLLLECQLCRVLPGEHHDIGSPEITMKLPSWMVYRLGEKDILVKIKQVFSRAAQKHEWKGVVDEKTGAGFVRRQRYIQLNPDDLLLKGH